MNSEDLSFKVTNDNGEEVICDILSVIPNEINSEELYIVFTDYLLDENNEFVLQYGKVVKENDEYVLKSINDESVIDLIKDHLTDEIVEFAKNQVKENNTEKELDTFIRKNDLGINIEYTIIGYYDNYILYTDFVSDNTLVGIKIYADKKEDGKYVHVEENIARDIINRFNKDLLVNLINERK